MTGIFIIIGIIIMSTTFLILNLFENELSCVVDKAIYKLKVKKQDKLFHEYCERCRDYNLYDGRKMTTCQSCKYGACYPKQEQNYFRERIK